MRRQQRSSGAATSGTEPLSGDIASAGALLAERGALGLAWLDQDLVVRARYGALVDFVRLNEPVSRSVLPLIGLENEIIALRDAVDGVIELPAVSIVTAKTESPRLNLSIYWHQQSCRFLLCVAQAVARPDLAISLNREIRARLMAEAETLATSKELARVNRDLEAFAGIVSHDLKAPLRAVRYLVDDIEQAIRNDGLERASATLSDLRTQALRMSRMMTALLEYSSVGRRVDAIERVDTAALVQEVVRSIPRPKGFKVEIDGVWPCLETLAAPLDLVLRNLVENAIKHHDLQHGTVRLSAREAPPYLAIEVSDDGPGINPRHHAAAFLPFRKLRDDNSTGTGMGLALVTRTLDEVGGRLELQSNPPERRGAAFHVLWPLTISS